MGSELKAIDEIRRAAIQLAVQFGPRVLIAIILIVAGAMVGNWIGKLTDRALRRLQLEPPVRGLLVRTVRLVVMILFVIMALQNLGVQLLPLIAGLGVAGAGIALAMQGVLGNVVAGLTIIFTKPFRVGEFISIVGEEGQVADISMFSTVLSHPDLSQVIIPNRKIVGEILHNYGRIRQIEINISVALDTDLDKALAAIDDVLKANARLLKEPRPVVAVAGVVNAHVNLIVKPWTSVTDYAAASGELRKAIVETFRSRQIAIPASTHEVRLIGAT